MTKFETYFNDLCGCLDNIEVTNETGDKISLMNGYHSFISNAKKIYPSKLIFIGNGGSAAIASHMAIDYSKAGEIPAIALNDPAALTCLSNDLGYERVFSEQLRYQYKAGDVIVAISSSGQSKNILNAVDLFLGATVVTLSGFSADNPLRKMGHLNFYVPSYEYGFVELAHQIILHGILDIYNEERK